MLKDVVYFYLLNASSAFCLAAAHNALYFALNLRTIVLHFLHYMCTFSFLFLCSSIGMKDTKPQLILLKFRKVVATQVLLVFLSNLIHSQERTGSLYLIRLFDFLTLATVVKLCNGDAQPFSSTMFKMLLPIGVGGSLSWMEFGIIEFTALTLVLSPVYAVLRGIQIVQIQNCYKDAGCSPEIFNLHYCGIVSLALSPFAFYSWLTSHVELQASWESIDYVLIGMSTVFMALYKHSELWLLLQLECRNFVILEQSRHYMASIGQWFIQNMAHACIFSVVGKLMMFGGLVRYFCYMYT